MHELRYALRQLLKSPGFTLASVITLALGIGANVAVFSVMNAVLLNPTGIPDAQNLVALRAKYTSMADLQNISVSAPDFQDSLESRNVFATAAAMQPASFNYSADNARPERLVGAQVTAQWFDVFEAKPLLGRTFRPEDDVPGAGNVVVLSHRFWQKQFGSDTGIVGRKLQLNGMSFEVIGVMDSSFNWPNDAQLWSPIAQPVKIYHDPDSRFNENLFAVARLQPGVSVEQANAVESSLTQQVVAKVSFAKGAGWGMFAMPLREYIAGDTRKPLNILLAAVVLVLLIACANIAGLQLARASDRQHENSVRAALGASRARLMATPFLESILLAICGLGLGIVVAIFAMPPLLFLAPKSISSNIQAHLNLQVLVFGCVATAVCVLLCGVAPALHAAGSRFIVTLRESGRSGTSGRGMYRMRSALVAAEITIAMFLLVGSGLLFQSLKTVEHLSTGFEPAGVMTASLSLPQELYSTDARQVAFFDAAVQNLRNIPGVKSAAFISDLPFAGGQGSASFGIKGQIVPPDSPGPHGHVDLISSDYFQTLGIPVVAGRAFTDADRPNTQPVAMVDETLARQYWPGKNVLDGQISIDGKTWRPIVGVVKHVKVSSLDTEANEGYYYLPVTQVPNQMMSVIVRGNLSHPENLLGGMEAAIRAVDSRQPLFDAEPMEQRVEESIGNRRFVVVLLGIFAGLSFFLAGLGLYAVIAYLVRMRVREIGIRFALGAQRSHIASMTLGDGLRMAVAGCVLGIVVTYSAGQVLSSMLYGISLYNLPIVAGSCVLLAALVVLASYLPIRRAVRVEPIEALRES
jgi:predicted permease